MKLSMLLASLAASFSIEDNAPAQRNLFKLTRRTPGLQEKLMGLQNMLGRDDGFGW
ncbi:unnamed protein product [Oikopleura dioica]|uniref:Uncharacterized protein n=1 Tax=Oikopleura dioica TaxID=34765 RepID=E4WRY5_OIKDI|nr:unnamed protein product [Oikopleura dioica]